MSPDAEERRTHGKEAGFLSFIASLRRRALVVSALSAAPVVLVAHFGGLVALTALLLLVLSGVIL